MLPTLIKTSFFEDPQEIINYSKKIEWIKSTNQDNWPGYRSDNLFKINKELHYYIINEIVRLYFRGKQVQIGSTKIQFHKN